MRGAGGIFSIMEKAVLQEKIKELESLNASYCLLSEKQERVRDVDFSYGIFAIYEKLRSILDEPEMYGIIRKHLGDIYEDYVDKVCTDTPDIIELLKKVLDDELDKMGC